VVDSAQWRERARKGKFDLLAAGSTFIVPPGNELKSYYHSSSINTGSGNSWGIDHPVVDALIEQLIQAKDSQRHYAIMHALDRVLLAHYYAVPLYYRASSWLAYWDLYTKPALTPKYSVGITSTWSIDPNKKPLGKK
jgi:microcin C transport system substrate-binding protein